MDKREREIVDRAYKIADLILTHQRRALITLAGRGIGWRTARRILAKDYKDDDSFYREILRAERLYARTRRFWDIGS